MPETEVRFVNTPSVYSAKLEGYYYREIGNTHSLPVGVDEIHRMAYSLLVYDPDFDTKVLNHETFGFYSRIFPNPATNNISVNCILDEPENIVLLLTDLQGRTLQNHNLGNMAAGESYFQVDISGLQRGMYFLNIKAGGKNAVHKISKL